MQITSIFLGLKHIWTTNTTFIARCTMFHNFFIWKLSDWINMKSKEILVQMKEAIIRLKTQNKSI